MDETILLIDTIVEKTRYVYVFNYKCKDVSEFIEKIKEIIKQNKTENDFNQIDFLKLNNYLKKLLEEISLFQDEEWFRKFLNSSLPLAKKIDQINEILTSIKSSLESHGFKCLDISKDDLISDFIRIDDILKNSQYLSKQIIQERQNEIEDFLIQIYSLNSTLYQQEKSSIFENSLYKNYNGTMLSTNKKVLITQLVHRDKFSRLFPILSKIHHPYFEKFIGVSSDSSSIKFITRNKGIKLKDLLYDCVDTDDYDQIFELNDGDLTIIAYKIAQAMSYLHSQRVFHRDLNISNIFIAKGIDPIQKLRKREIQDEKLTKTESNSKDEDDSDVECESDEDDEVYPIITHLSNSRLFTNECLIGMTNFNYNSSSSSNFIAPDHLDNHSYDEKIDVFAFGAILYEILERKAPFEEYSFHTISVKLKKGERPKITNCPTKLKELINKCWNQIPDIRPTFDQIMEIMRSDKIVFPCDSEKSDLILRFYEENSIKSKKVKDCLDKFSNINNEIQDAYQYKFELLTARTILDGYKYLLQTSKYSFKENNSDEIEAKLDSLLNNLSNFSSVVKNTHYDEFIQNLDQDPVTKITEDICNTMMTIFNSMRDLNFTVIHYEERDEDLVFDYRELGYFFYNKTNFFKYSPLIDQINDFLQERKLDGEVSNEELLQRLKDLFAPFKSFEIKREYFKLYEDQYKQGGTSCVFCGKDIEFDTDVAIKTYSKVYLSRGEKTLITLRREIGYLTKLKNEFIVDFKGFSVSDENDDQLVWLVFEYVPSNLTDIVSYLSPVQKTQIAYKIAQAMEYLHSQQILHRDLKSSNVLIDSYYNPKITDFGFSRSDLNLPNMSRNIGTPNYMAPEVISSNRYGIAADVFSFGMLLYEIYTEKIPFDNLSPSRIEGKILKGVKLEFHSDCQKELVKLIKECTNKEAKLRPSFEQILFRMRDNDISFLNVADEKDKDEEYKEMEKEIIDFYQEKKNEIEEKNKK